MKSQREQNTRQSPRKKSTSQQQPTTQPAVTDTLSRMTPNTPLDLNAISQLQQMVGNQQTLQLLRERMHPTVVTTLPGNRSPLQRVKLNARAMKNIFSQVEGLKDLFAGNKVNQQSQTLLTHAEKMITVYINKFEASENDEIVANAMKLAAGAKTVGNHIAYELKNPWLGPEIAQKLLAYYGPEIQAKVSTLKGEDQKKQGEVLKLAGVIASASPFMLYMTDKINATEAAKKIIELAQATGDSKDTRLTPARMYHLMYQQYQMELGSFTKNEVESGSIGGGKQSGAYGVNSTDLSGEKDLIGELSSGHFESILNLETGGLNAGQTKWKTTGTTNTNQLDFKTTAQSKLDALEQEVTRVAQLVAPQPLQDTYNSTEWNRLTGAQKQNILKVEQREQQALAGGGIRNEVISALCLKYNILTTEANKLIDDYINNFNLIPLTISFPTPIIFGQNFDPNIDQLLYQSALKRELSQKELKTLLPDRQGGQKAQGNLELVGTSTGNTGMANARGNRNYMRWRYEKDVKPKGYSGIGPSELPEFAGLSPSFKFVHGSDLATHGQNQYGQYMADENGGKVKKTDTSHFKLDPALVDRAMFQFTAKGPLRRDPLMFLHDVAVTVPQETQGIIDQQVGGSEELGARNKQMQADQVLNSLMLNLGNGKISTLDQQQIEVQISGEIDLTRDVEKIFLNPQTTANKNTIKLFAMNNGIALEEYKKDPSITVNYMKRESSYAKIGETVRAYLRNKEEKSDETSYLKLGQTILNTHEIQANEQNLYNDIYRQFTKAFNKLGYFAKRKTINKNLLKQVKEHIVRIT